MVLFGSEVVLQHGDEQDVQGGGVVGHLTGDSVQSGADQTGNASI